MPSRRSRGRLGLGLVGALGIWLVLSSLGGGVTNSGSAVLHPATAPSPAATFTLSLAGVTPSALSLAWTQTTCFLGLASYTVAESTVGSGGPWLAVATYSTATDVSYAAAGFAPGATSWWMVTATGDLGNTCPSNVLQVTQPPSAVLSDSLVTATELQFNWTNNATYGGGLQFQSYAILESLAGHSPATVATITSVSTLTTSVPGLSPGSSYSFYVNTSDCYANCGSGVPSLSVSESNSVTYGAPTALTASASANRPTIDVGESDTFSCTATGGQSPYSFDWQFGNGSFAPGNRSISQEFSNVGPINAMCRVTDNQSSSYVASTTVVVATDPVPQVTANRTAVDVGQPINFNCTATGGFPPYSYAWSFGDGDGASTSEPSHSYASAGQRTATCTVTDATATAAVQFETIQVSPTLVVSAAASSPAAAPGTGLTFTATPANGSGTYSAYTWLFGDGTSGSGASIKHLYTTPGNYTASVSISDSNGARAGAMVTVVVTALVVSAVGPTSSGASVNQALAYTATATGGAGGPYNYTWTFGDGTHAYGASVSHRYATAGTYPVTLVVSDRLGATHQTTLSAVTVTVPAAPAPLVTAQLLLALAILFGVLAFFLGVALHRRSQRTAYASLAGRVPVTDPARTVQGSRVCRVCGAVNVPLRKTCEACGATLRGSLIR